VSYPILKRGANGPQVSALQRALQLAGHSLAVDGDFGTGTEAAVRTLQMKAGVAVDGVVGPATWRALENALGTSLNIPPARTTTPAAASAPPAKGSNWAVVAVPLGVLLLGGGAVLAWKYVAARGKE
jgi:peptidoglycan hydrolase-like protein with peptidoglycan-binding domain